MQEITRSLAMGTTCFEASPSASQDAEGDAFEPEHLAQMQNDAVWGTEHDIIAAAYLFNISIICYSKYYTKQLCLQHFAPHFLSSGTCDNTCNHPTLYLINSSGVHYNLATVSLLNHFEE